MAALRIEGYVIVSADGMLADARNVMPDELKFEGDKAFFTAALDRADLILHGRNSYEDQPNSPRRKRLILTRKVRSLAPDPSNPNATLWNPAGASFEAACEQIGNAELGRDIYRLRDKHAHRELHYLCVRRYCMRLCRAGLVSHIFMYSLVIGFDEV